MKITIAKIKDFSIRLQEALKLAIVSMYSSRMRSILTVTGIVIGVGTVVGLISLTTGLQNYMTQAFDMAGTDSFWLVRMNFLITSYEDFFEARNRPNITVDDAWAIRDNCPSVGYATPQSVTIGTVKYRGKSIDNIYIIGTSEEFQNMQGLEIEEGRILLNSDVERSRDVCGLGYETKQALFGDRSCIGKQVKINGHNYTVIGTVKPLGTVMGENRDTTALIPITSFNKYFANTRINSNSRVIIKPVSPELQEKAIDEVTMLMRSRHGLKANEKNDFYVMPQTAFMDTFNELTGVIFVVIIAVGGISLLVGGVGIMNIMLVSVSERTREVGLRKSLGARNSDIQLQFLLEAIIMSMIGGLLGVGLGIMLAELVATLTPLPALISPFSVILGVTFSTTIGIFFGIYPARKAAKLDPIVALRFD